MVERFGELAHERGIGRALLRAVEAAARERGCARLTLEVLANNDKARRMYERAGLAQAGHGGPTGGALFYTKHLIDDGAVSTEVAEKTSLLEGIDDDQ